jgi:hypothetical protein
MDDDSIGLAAEFRMHSFDEEPFCIARPRSLISSHIEMLRRMLGQCRSSAAFFGSKAHASGEGVWLVVVAGV